MILFQTSTWQYDLSNIGITFNETSNYFSEEIVKSYSFPFNVYLDEEIAEKLGLVNIENIRSYKKKIYGILTKENQIYNAYISINQIKGSQVELTIFYGDEVLPVFDKKLNQLSFPVITATGGLITYAKTLITKAWPETSHNFVKLYRPELKKADKNIQSSGVKF